MVLRSQAPGAADYRRQSRSLIEGWHCGFRRFVQPTSLTSRSRSVILFSKSAILRAVRISRLSASMAEPRLKQRQTSQRRRKSNIAFDMFRGIRGGVPQNFLAVEELQVGLLIN
jgi:hypothetical protein